MATSMNDENQEQTNSGNKSLEAAVHNTAIQMGCWTAADDYLLITSIMHLCDLERVHQRVKFSMPFTLENIQDRWQCLLYDASISKMIVSKVQQLSMSQIETLHIPLNEDEEQLLASIPSSTIPTLVDDEIDTCLSKNSPKFWANRTIDELREYWLEMRQQGLLIDQQETNNSEETQTLQELAFSRKLSQLLAPFEFELLSRDKEQFANKTDPPHAILYVNNRLYCMYTEELKFGTSFPDRQFDISFDNSTKIHIQGLIVYKLESFYIINNGDNAFRVNNALLNPNEASPLGTRAVINNMDRKRAPLPPPLPSFVLRSFASGVTCVKYDLRDSLRLYVAEQEGSVYLYNLRTRQPILTLPDAHTSTILGLSQLIDRNKLVTFSKDGFVKIWNDNGQCEWNYQTHHCSFSNCDIISPNLILAPIGNNNSTIAAFDYQCANPIVKKFTPLSTDINNGMVMKLRVYDNRLLFVVYESGSLNVFDILTTKQLDAYQITSDHEPVTAMDVVCDTCICGTTKSDLISIDFSSSSSKLQPTPTFRHIDLPNAGTSFIRCRPDDGKLIAAAGWDSRVRLFRRETGKQLAMLDLHRQQVNSIDFDFHTRQIVCASEDRTVSIWDVYNNELELSNGDETAEKILDAKKPVHCKALGRHVEPFNEEPWMENRTEIV
ncbi:unnamed protein product [Rotaria socialis]|uniref:Microspherule protein N-terminal domain-containing protein n=2 Tax=Rotaria socialis TaxID=392032 RepID=A0A819W109_9BILA|nr:unnamed protein product [Rotaria socialis]